MKDLESNLTIGSQDYQAIWRAWTYRELATFDELPQEEKERWPESLYEIEVGSFLRSLRKAGYVVIKDVKLHVSDEALKAEAELLERQEKEG